MAVPFRTASLKVDDGTAGRGGMQAMHEPPRPRPPRVDTSLWPVSGLASEGA
ncbi:MAG: hypothetical protein AVDCRST_MAG71-830 [uncultured Lysobacter sp.]|uniref:Uncharacterized protein n=1 Tax=uncultured Lysobacter sp. TaxID=271060 RepID=A0A6J4KSB5_9GAMM|nr:MAG: hypothetical protein AVDCRST_MAG71-830 [uncultured Lysobacter sp.]